MSLRDMRQEKGLTIQALAEQIGVSHVSIIHWEKGDRTPNGKYIAKLAEALDKSVEEVLEGLKIS